MKQCTKCQVIKNTSEFHYFKNSKDKLYNWCKECKKEYDSLYRKSDKIQKYYQSSLYRDRKKEYQKFLRDNSPELIIFRQTKARAKKMNIPFDLNIEDIQIPEYCPILNIKLCSNKGYKNRDNSPSIDKIIPELGYIKNNIWIISLKANVMKNNATLSELELFCNNMLKIIKNIKK